MRYLELESLGYKGILNHSILQDGNTILSFEDGVFKIYKNSFLKNRRIVKSYRVPKIDLKQYKDLKIDSLTCYEAIEFIYKLENKKMNTYRTLNYFILVLIGLIILLCGIWFGHNLNEETVAFINNIFDYE